MWHPESQRVASMRRDIDRHPRRIKEVLTEERMRKEFFDGCSKNEAKAVKAFVSANAGNALKTKPKVRTALWKDESVKAVPVVLSRTSLRLC